MSQFEISIAGEVFSFNNNARLIKTPYEIVLEELGFDELPIKTRKIIKGLVILPLELLKESSIKAEVVYDCIFVANEEDVKKLTIFTE